ncbi:hypothetical protein H310_02487 [Aphanomyces invadans]|uniref:FUZ/MON1/HPS1 first Longin domain-containing protein n=1 Tax=Aphanomyces invadans TaxID=157072 RepID=A0A024UQL2_9STRA|nr:hypothetical protein H310_02487 [Aphanomyces invadans]ETW08147.1 hypothetical protein H310_02487 [Aphanomyces invadans]|eukprot:XP_008864240.1 hypothetical protein H310_02487 [Aphanomyces invadans]
MSYLPEVHILSGAGKPIFSTKDADNCDNVARAGLIQGLSSFADDALRQITTPTHELTFLPSPPLLFFCATPSSLRGLNVGRLLHLLKHHLLVFLTQNGVSLIESNPSYDLRNLLYGTHGVLMAVVSAWTSTVWPQLDGFGVRCVRMTSPSMTRPHIQSGMDVPGLVFGLVSHGDSVVAYKQGLPDHPLPIEDVHVLLHILQHMPSFRKSESWTPLCLPTFNRGGFLYGYVLFLSNGMSVLLLSNDQSQRQFYTFQTQTRRVLEPLLLKAFPPPPAAQPCKPLPQLPGQFQPLLLHFFCQSFVTHEVVCPPFEECTLLESPSWRLHVLRVYHTLHQRLHPTKSETLVMGGAPSAASIRSSSTYFLRADTMVALGLVKPQLGLMYVCCQPLLTAEQTTDLAESLWHVLLESYWA